MEIQRPLRLAFADESKGVLVVEWPDGHGSPYPLPYLRGWCPCAACQGHSVEHVFRPHSATRIVGMQTVGNYAVAMAFDDGHGTGIYTFDWLRRCCPCAECGGPLDGTPPDVAALVPPRPAGGSPPRFAPE